MASADRLVRRRPLLTAALVSSLALAACASSTQAGRERPDATTEPVGSPSPSPDAAERGSLAAAETERGSTPVADKRRRSRGSDPRLPDVTKTGPTKGTVKVGVLVLTNTEAFAQSLGFEVTAVDAEAQAKAIIKEVNRSGGLAGRQIVPVFGYSDATDPAPYASSEQSLCAQLTEDNRVSIAISSGYYPIGGVLVPCLAKRGVPFVHSGHLTLWGKKESLDPFPFFVPGSTSLDRAADFFVDRLYRKGFFDKGAKIGLFRDEAAQYTRVANTIIKPALARRGLRLTAEAAVGFPRSTAEYVSSGVAQIQNAVLRFRALGVTHVLPMSWGGTYFFMTAAESNGYRPRYGLTTQDIPNVLQTEVPVEHLRRALGVGWGPFADVDDQRDPGRTAAQTRCLDIMRRAGLGLADRRSKGAAFGACDAFFVLQSASQKVPALTATEWRSAFEALGSGFDPALIHTSRLGRGRHDGVAVVRDLAFSQSCTCFKYTSGPISVP